MGRKEDRHQLRNTDQKAYIMCLVGKKRKRKGWIQKQQPKGGIDTFNLTAGASLWFPVGIWKEKKKLLLGDHMLGRGSI